MEIDFILSGGIGAGLGALVAGFYSKTKRSVLEERISNLTQQGETLQHTQERERAEFREQSIHKEKLHQEALQRVQSDLRAAQETASKLETRLSVQVSALETEKRLLEESKKQLKVEFENLAQKILEEKTKVFQESSEKNLGQLLGPLKEKIMIFEKSVEEKYSTEAKERVLLKSEIERLVTLSQSLSTDAKSLTDALKGDSKVQGDWGELTLTRLFESAGLEEGREYMLQMNIKGENEQGEEKNYRPDAMLLLPEQKHLIIDAKVSLKSYEEYRSAAEETARDAALNRLVESMDRHISDLQERAYHQAKGLNSPEFVFMFIPLEGAYLAAMQKDPKIVERAWNKKVAIVTATTLFTTLKTVASVWMLDRQRNHALEIAEEGGKLYDKFCGFLEDFDQIGVNIDRTQKAYGEAVKKAKDGNANIVKQAQKLKELGSKTKKKLPKKFEDALSDGEAEAPDLA